MLVFAHRGANRRAPENTVAAFDAAIALGADGVEFDVHRTADGALVVRHDAATALGRLGDVGLAALRAGLPELPTFVEALDACAGRVVNVEMKDPDPRAVDALVEILATRAGADDVLVSSFHPHVVDGVRAAAGDLPTGVLAFGVAPESVLATAVAGGHRSVHPDAASILQIDASEFVAQAHRLGVRVYVWTVNDPGVAQVLRDAGVDGIITDDDSLYRRWRSPGRPPTGEGTTSVSASRT